MALLDDLISGWEMNDTGGANPATDEHAANDLTDVNGPASAAGKIGNARTFDGVNQYFKIASALVTLPFSLSCWFKPNSTRTMVGGGVSGSNNFAWGIAVSASNKLQCYFSDGAASFDDLSGTTTLTVDGTVWYHALLVCRSATDRQIYLNGASEGTSSANRTLSGSANIFAMGVYAPSENDYYTGAIDQTAIWSADKSGDLAELYNAGSGLAYSSWTAGGSDTPEMLDWMREQVSPMRPRTEIIAY
jgi:hypothetical protein